MSSFVDGEGKVERTLVGGVALGSKGSGERLEGVAGEGASMVWIWYGSLSRTGL